MIQPGARNFIRWTTLLGWGWLFSLPCQLEDRHFFSARLVLLLVCWGAHLGGLLRYNSDQLLRILHVRWPGLRTLTLWGALGAAPWIRSRANELDVFEGNFLGCIFRRRLRWFLWGWWSPGGEEIAKLVLLWSWQHDMVWRPGLIAEKRWLTTSTTRFNFEDGLTHL